MDQTCFASSTQGDTLREALHHLACPATQWEAI